MRTKTKTRTPIGLLAAFLSSAVCTADSPRYSTRRYTTDDGLPQTRVSCLAQTPDGYLWCGTWFGLARFDGVRFVTFDRHNTPALAANEAIQSLTVDGRGVLWVGTQKALVRRTNQGWVEVPWAAGWGGHGVADLWPLPGGGVWAAGEHGLVHADGTNTTFAPLSADFGFPSFATTPAGGLFLHRVSDARHHLWKHDPKTDSWQSLPLQQFATREEMRRSSASNGGHWLHYREGVVPWPAPGKDKAHPLQDELWVAGIVASSPAHDGGVWLVDRPGRLWHWQVGQAEVVQIHPAPDFSRGVAAIFEDREANLWVSSDDALVRLRRRGIRSFNTRDGLPDDEVWTLAPAREGGVWAGTRGGGVARISENHAEPLPVLQVGKQSRSTIHSVLEDSRGRLLANTSHGAGLFQFSGGAWLPWPDTGSYGEALYEDRLGRVWLGGGGGSAWHDGTQWHHQSQTNGLPNADIRVIHQSRDGLMWFGTRRSGLVRMEERTGEVRGFGPADGLATDDVWAIHETPDGALWIGGNRGLARLDTAFVGADVRKLNLTRNSELETRNSSRGLLTSAPKIFAFSPAHGLPNDAVNWILEDGQGHLWLSGLRGLHRVSRAELEAIAHGERRIARCATYGVVDGMETAETNGEHAPAGCVDREGRLWFPTGKGAVRIDPQAVNVSEQPPTVLIEEATVDGEPVYGFRFPGSSSISETATNLKLKPGRARLLQFRYTAPTFVNAERARFRHRLRGLNDAWHEAREERVAYFNDLKPGDYVFEVTACNAHGVWQETPATFAFFLAPSFSQTAWFPASFALCGATLAGAFVTWRLRWQRRSMRAEQTAALADERARIARDLHDELGTALTGVALELDVLRQGSVPTEASRLGEAAGRTRALAERMREVVWAINPHCDTIPSLALFLEQQAVPFLRAAKIACRLDYPEELPRLPLAAPLRHQLALGVREALTNVVRHSGASEVWLRLGLTGDRLTVEVIDNGRGFDPAQTEAGHGLANLRERFALLNGSSTFHSAPGRGTRVVFSVPLGSDSPFPT